mgnify:CR=1 FL=1
MEAIKKRLPFSLALAALTAILLAVAVLSLRLGSAHLSWSAFFGGLFHQKGFETETLILYAVRLPRLTAAVLAGAGLSVSGVLLQSVTGNDLASPGIIGVSSGAGFMVILCLSFFPAAFVFVPAAAFGTTLLILTAANKIGGGKQTFILAGIAFTAILNAAISFLSLLDTDVLTAYNYFSVGGLSGVQTKSLIVPGAVIFVCIGLCLCLARRINLLCLGDGLASSLGVRVRLLRTVCLILASASAGAVVSFAGLLGFVGLVIPHIARRLFGMNTKRLLAAAPILGAVLVLLGDLLGRVALAPTEIPVGIVMSAIGAPFFFGLLLKKSGGNYA